VRTYELLLARNGRLDTFKGDHCRRSSSALTGVRRDGPALSMQILTNEHVLRNEDVPTSEDKKEEQDHYCPDDSPECHLPIVPGFIMNSGHRCCRLCIHDLLRSTSHWLIPGPWGGRRYAYLGAIPVIIHGIFSIGGHG
jgi:hypothetical protein